jgi:hypothetical protein
MNSARTLVLAREDVSVCNALSQHSKALRRMSWLNKDYGHTYRTYLQHAIKEKADTMTRFLSTSIVARPFFIANYLLYRKEVRIK